MRVKCTPAGDRVGTPPPPWPPSLASTCQDQTSQASPRRQRAAGPGAAPCRPSGTLPPGPSGPPSAAGSPETTPGEEALSAQPLCIPSPYTQGRDSPWQCHGTQPGPAEAPGPLSPWEAGTGPLWSPPTRVELSAVRLAGRRVSAPALGDTNPSWVERREPQCSVTVVGSNVPSLCPHKDLVPETVGLRLFFILTQGYVY